MDKNMINIYLEVMNNKMYVKEETNNDFDFVFFMFRIVRLQIITSLRMRYRDGHPVTANYVVEYLDSCSTVYTHLARLSWELASHIHLSMIQLIEVLKCIWINSHFVFSNKIEWKWMNLTTQRCVVVAECFVLRNIGIQINTLIQILDAITKWTDGKIFVAKRL